MDIKWNRWYQHTILEHKDDKFIVDNNCSDYSLSNFIMFNSPTGIDICKFMSLMNDPSRKEDRKNTFLKIIDIINNYLNRYEYHKYSLCGFINDNGLIDFADTFLNVILNLSQITSKNAGYRGILWWKTQEDRVKDLKIALKYLQDETS